MLFKSQNNMLFKTQLSYAPQVQYFNSPKVIYLHLKRLMINTNQFWIFTGQYSFHSWCSN